MKKGFTLIEILVAMAILVIVIGSSLAIFRASANSWRRGEMRAQRYQQARFILERLSREISSIVPASSAGPYCFGTSDKFYFITALVDAPASLVEVGYWLEDGAEELVRSYQTTPDYDFSTYEAQEALSENVSALNFEYSTGVLWLDNWDSRPQGAQAQMLPKAVKISFDIRDQKEETTESFDTVVSLAAAQK